MQHERRIHFPPFALDLVNECLWQDERAIKLRPKAFAVLEQLLVRAGELVTKEHLIHSVWHDTFVGDAVLKVAVRQIREALADDPKSPRFIETAHRRGYRFIGEITVPVETRARTVKPPGGFVGRAAALSRLHEWLHKARDGESQVVFVTGEAGIGKTTLLDTFVRAVAPEHRVRVCSGQCLEQYGMSEAYLPVLDAIRQLCQEHAHAIDVLRAHAPMWLMQMPSFVTAEDREHFGREMHGATRERMLREMGQALDALTADTALVLVLEDLHWSDVSTLDLLSYVARGRRNSHLMVVGTYRPAELIASRHPLKAVKRELFARGQCEELPLEYLTREAVVEHVAARFPVHHFPADLVAVLHERTEGNPLFMVNTIDHLIAERLIEPREDGWHLAVPIETLQVGVPDSIRQLIETQIERLTAEDRRVLEAASVAGPDFSAVAISAALERDLVEIEERCEELSRRHQFIRSCGAHRLPNGQTVGRFGFVHAVYRHVLYDSVSPSRRMQLHQRVGQGGEEVYGAQAPEIAAELAMHFEQAGDIARAVRYLQQAAVNAMHRSAYREAIALSRQGLQLLEVLPDTDDRSRQEVTLLTTLGVPLIAIGGYAAPEVGRVYVKARRLCKSLGGTLELPHVLWGLWTFHTLRAELSTALTIAGEFLRLAERIPHAGVAMRGHWSMEITSMHRGDFRLALEHYESMLSVYDPEHDYDDLAVNALNPGVAARCFASWCLWFIGQPDRAVVRIEEAVALARRLSEPHGLTHALSFAAVLHQLRGEKRIVQQYADAAMRLAGEHGLAFYGAMAQMLYGWAQTGQGRDQHAAEQIREGLTTWQGTGAQLMVPHFLTLLTDALPATASEDPGLRVLDEALALAHATGERMYEAEIGRLRGERLLQGTPHAATVKTADACFAQALAVAREQGALSLELRAAMSRVRQHAGRGTGAFEREELRAICDRFDARVDTTDIRQARALLALPT